MQKYLRLAGNDIPVNYYEGFREKATITIPTNEIQVLSFWDIVSLLETNDINELSFYIDDENNHERVYDGKLIGYTRLSTTVNNREAQLGSITLLKPNVNNMDLNEVKEVMSNQIDSSDRLAETDDAICTLYEMMVGEQNG